MSDEQKLYGIQKADGTFYPVVGDTEHNCVIEAIEHVTELRNKARVYGTLAAAGFPVVEVEIVRAGTVAELTEVAQTASREFVGALAVIGNMDDERAAIVARLEAIDDAGNHSPVWALGELRALLSDLKAGRVEGKT